VSAFVFSEGSCSFISVGGFLTISASVSIDCDYYLFKLLVERHSFNVSMKGSLKSSGSGLGDFYFGVCCLDYSSKPFSDLRILIRFSIFNL
jgi:hypothetical protein